MGVFRRLEKDTNVESRIFTMISKSSEGSKIEKGKKKKEKKKSLLSECRYVGRRFHNGNKDARN